VRALGDDAVLLHKPFGLDELYAAIRSVLGEVSRTPG
jgi:DNA-binding response OmpR family regulator